MKNASILRTATAFALTIAIGYSACTLVFWAFPDAAIAFMNALFHGLDFRKLAVGPPAFQFGSFAFAGALLAVWGFMLGVVFGWLQSVATPHGESGPERAP